MTTKLKRTTTVELAKAAARAHSDVNAFYSCIAVLEGGTLYTPAGMRASYPIVRSLRAASRRAFREYDSIVTELVRRDELL